MATSQKINCVSLLLITVEKLFSEVFINEIKTLSMHFHCYGLANNMNTQLSTIINYADKT